MVLYKRNKEELALRFKTTNSNNKNWFSQANILESPWQDILTASKNYFTLDGPCWSSGCRDFHINHAYGGCPNDFGWLSIGNAAVCKWESRHPSGVKLVYNKIATQASYNEYSKLKNHLTGFSFLTDSHFRSLGSEVSNSNNNKLNSFFIGSECQFM